MNNDRTPALLLKISTMAGSLSNAEKLVAAYICENPEEVIHLSVAGLAEASGVSDATVIRMCRHVGLDSYQDLKVSLAQDIVSPLQSIHEEIKPDDSVEAIVDKVFQGTLHALTFTHDVLKISSIEQAANAIMNAETVFIMGIGNSHAIALDFQHKLMRLGIKAAAFTDPHLAAIAAINHTERDVVVAISHSGSSRDIVENAKIAKKSGAKIISLTSIGTSPLSKISDIQLYTASKETQYRIVAMNSRIAQMAIIDAIYTVIAARKPSAVDNFHRIEQALKHKKY
ncbi:MAG: MurR/RpiR family transcriptional regulator [Oscillospiraceae bacterium]